MSRPVATVNINFENLLQRFPTEIEPLMDERMIHLRLGHTEVIKYLQILSELDPECEDSAAMGGL